MQDATRFLLRQAHEIIPFLFMQSKVRRLLLKLLLQLQVLKCEEDDTKAKALASHHGTQGRGLLLG